MVYFCKENQWLFLQWIENYKFLLLVGVGKYWEFFDANIAGSVSGMNFPQCACPTDAFDCSLWRLLYHSEICRSKKRRGLIWPLWLHLTMLNLRWSFTHLMLDQLLILCICVILNWAKNSCSLFQETGSHFRRRGIQYSFSIIKLYS